MGSCSSGRRGRYRGERLDGVGGGVRCGTDWRYYCCGVDIVVVVGGVVVGAVVEVEIEVVAEVVAEVVVVGVVVVVVVFVIVTVAVS